MLVRTKTGWIFGPLDAFISSDVCQTHSHVVKKTFRDRFSGLTVVWWIAFTFAGGLADSLWLASSLRDKVGERQ